MWKHNRLAVLQTTAGFLIGAIVMFLIGASVMWTRSGDIANQHYADPTWHYQYGAPLLVIAGMSLLVGFVVVLVIFLVRSAD